MFVRLEWEAGGYRDCFLGIPTEKTIRKEHRDHQARYWNDVEHAVAYFERNIGGIGKIEQGEITHDDNWMIWRWAIPPYRDWDWSNPRPWAEITTAGTDGVGADNVVEWFAGAIRDFWAAIDAYFEQHGGSRSQSDGGS